MIFFVTIFYFIEWPITKGQIEKLEKGIALFGEKTKATEIQKLSKTSFRIILREGKNRQIRRICRKVGNPVVRLKRIRIGNLKMPTLAVGTWRYLSENRTRKSLVKNEVIIVKS